MKGQTSTRTKVLHALMIVVLTILLLLFIAPFILVVINVFKTKADINTAPLALIGKHGFTLENFPRAMDKMNFVTVFGNPASNAPMRATFRPCWPSGMAQPQITSSMALGSSPGTCASARHRQCRCPSLHPGKHEQPARIGLRPGLHAMRLVLLRLAPESGAGTGLGNVVARSRADHQQ